MRDPFTYIPPNETAAPKHAAIRKAWDLALTRCRDAVVDDCAAEQRYKMVNEAARSFYEAIEATCPASADTSAALRCVRLARMAANEAIACARRGDDTGTADNDRRCIDNLIAARWQACAAIALGD